MNAIQQTMTPNKLETLGYSILDESKIDYIKQHLMFNKFCVDAYIPSKNIVVQFDGDYWHGNPNKFAHLDSRQKKRQNLDKSQDAYFKKCDVKVCRIWESDLVKDPAKYLALFKSWNLNLLSVPER
jgi:very-short-patch-repair endonuclease